MDVADRVRRDAGLLAGDPEAAALLECLGKRLFDSGLDVGSMLKVCGSSRPVRERLVAKIGPLKTWVTELRMAEAERLLRESTLPIKELGERVGYLVERTFRRAFQDAFDQNPSEMRKEARIARASQAAGAGPAGAGPAHRRAGEPELEADGRVTRRALAGRLRRRYVFGLLDPRSARKLHARLRHRHPGLDEKDARRRREAAPGEKPGEAPGPGADAAAAGAERTVVLTPTGDPTESVVAETVLEEIAGLPDEELRFALLHGVRFSSFAPYYQLLGLCRRLIPHDSERAVTIAELGVQLVEPHRETLGEAADQWKALMWTFLGHVQIDVGDVGGAEQSLAFAGAEVGGTDALEPWVEIELRQVEGLVRTRQRRYDEAARALDRAVELGRRSSSLGVSRLQPLFHRLELAAVMDDAAAGLAFSSELEELVDTWQSRGRRASAPEDLALWRAYATYHRGRAFAAAGDDARAGEVLQQTIRDLAQEPDCQTDLGISLLLAFSFRELARVGIRQGYLEDGEEFLRDALDLYQRFEAPLHQAATEAELAVVRALRGGWAEARQLATASAAYLDALPFHREAWTAAHRLRELANGGEASREELVAMMQDLRRDLELVTWEIAAARTRPATRLRIAREAEG